MRRGQISVLIAGAGIAGLAAAVCLQKMGFATTVVEQYGALRTHGGDGPAGEKNDAYQVLLLLAAHSGRHTAQIFEIEQSPNYPRGR